jgi:DNA (cytosine-5)-methyltransferase 1
MLDHNQDAGAETKEEVQAALEAALLRAEACFDGDTEADFGLSTEFKQSLKQLSDMSEKASTAFTNIITCLAIKAAKPNVDVRYHQVQIQAQTLRAAGFNFRGLSESVIYPWINDHNFVGAQSGWQTRTLERPKPYMMDYEENIGHVKMPFLTCFDQMEEHGQSGEDGLAYILYHQLILRKGHAIVLSVPRTKDIQVIVSVFQKHFFAQYKGKATHGASRLPVLALYAIYTLMIDEFVRFTGMRLKPLEEHSAADAQTGAIGDIEVVSVTTGEVFEAVEVKHNIVINDVIIQGVRQKIMATNVDRYYILTTHRDCDPKADLAKTISEIELLYACQVIANGVLPTLKYYLRILRDPSKVFEVYTRLLRNDKAISHEHRKSWNEIAIT